MKEISLNKSNFGAYFYFMFDLNKPLVQWLLLIFLAFVWGSSFILMKKGLITFSPQQVAALRILISFIFLIPVIIWNFRKIKRNQWWKVFFAGLLGSGIPAFLFPLAQTKISSSLAGMLNSLVPLFVVIIGVLFFRTPFRKLKFLGVFIGLVGATGLLYSNSFKTFTFTSETLIYASLVVVSTICYAINVNFIKNALQQVSSLNISSFGFLLIGPIAGVYLFSTDFTTIVSTGSDTVLLHLFYIALLAIFGTAIAIILFNMLIKKVSAVYASSVTYIIPVFAIFWGIMDNEQFLMSQLLFICIILFGVFIVNKDNELERKEGKIKKTTKKTASSVE